MRILSVDTATECASCSVIDDKKLLSEISFNNKKQHSVILMPMIDYMLKTLNIDLSSIDGYVISKGPGSFTGLRIGMSVIKGLSQGTNKPFISVSSLDALAFNMAYTSGLICPILDALRGHVYTAIYEYKNNKLNRLSGYLIISIEELVSMLLTYNQNICFIGDATKLHEKYLKDNLASVSFAPVHLNIVKASSLGELGLELLENGTYDDINTAAPIYLRKSQAEREYENKLKNNNNE